MCQVHADLSVPNCREELSFGDLEVFENDDKTRTFLSLGISNGRNRVTLSRLLCYCIASK